MKIDRKHFEHILQDLLDESPLACRGLFGICRIEFTSEVDTLCVTLGRPSVLRVNLAFLAEHCQNETHVKTVLVHEFLHVLLRHTEKIVRMTPLLNLALDSVINAIIHRKLGPAYSEFMSLYYREAVGPARLLRPLGPSDHTVSRSAAEETDLLEEFFFEIWNALYSGQLVADDIYEIVRQLQSEKVVLLLPQGRVLLGNHDPGSVGLDLDELDPQVARQLRQTLDTLEGKGLWPGPGADLRSIEIPPVGCFAELERWRQKTLKVLKACLTFDQRRSLAENTPRDYFLPVLNNRDRRGFVRSLWNPLIPAVTWQGEVLRPLGTAQIYLDVSGSMDREIGHLLRLLVSFSTQIRQPFWAFSNRVAPAWIRNGRLETRGTGGTSINAVLEHIVRTRPGRAVIITDGFVEECDPRLVGRLAGQKIHVLISARGKKWAFENHGFSCTELSDLPDES